MRRSIVFTLSGLIVVTLVLGLWWKDIIGRREKSPLEVPKEQGEHQESISTEQPLEIQLFVNDFEEITISPGTPLIFSLVIRNRAAILTSHDRMALEKLKEELDKEVKANEMTREQADWVLKREEHPGQVQPIGITFRAEAFSFALEGAKGVQSLPWQPKAVEPQVPASVILDEKEVVHAMFVVPPESTTSKAEGTYRVVAFFEDKSAKPGQWKGRIVSNPALITVKKEAEAAEDKTQREMALAEYFVMVKDYGKAEKAINEALSGFPELIRGLFLRGEIYEATGDFRPALESYGKALGEFQRRFPGHNAPWGLWEKIRKMWEKLGIQVPEVVE